MTAVAFVDVVGYSTLMSEDEARTHERWMAILSDIIRPQTKRHSGTVVKSTGDGILAEFPSAVAAVQWSQDVQDAVHLPKADGDSGPPIALRIAVNLGDVIDGDKDIYGDGVNVAARLQEYAAPGGIILSEAIYDLVRGTFGTQARDLGYLRLKNIEKPARAYSLDSRVQDISVPARPRLESMPSIAVLPLQNLGGDPADDYFGDGIVEDVIVSLASLRELQVISRASTLTYRGRQPDPREVAKGLGVGYVLMGTIRRSAQVVRVSIQLCDARSGASIWAERAEVSPGEIFDLQDRIVWKIVAGIAPHVRAAELEGAMRKRPGSFTAYDHTLRGLEIINSLDATNYPRALDPQGTDGVEAEKERRSKMTRWSLGAGQVAGAH